MVTLQRITTEYVDQEDRVRFSGESNHGETISFWMTQRLLSRVIASILPWVAQGDDPHVELKNTFAQQAARAGLEPQGPVVAPSTSLLVSTVDITQGAEHLTLTFKTSAEALAKLTLRRQDVRQWLNILHDTWRRAAWSMSVWPQWMEEGTAETELKARALLH
ncbi:MAG: hypothetical protein RJA34_1671 [Pseudomonadota bacterium]|jgi:hypothetical protein